MSATEKIEIQENVKTYIVDILVPFSENCTQIKIILPKRKKGTAEQFQQRRE